MIDDEELEDTIEKAMLFGLYPHCENLKSTPRSLMAACTILKAIKAYLASARPAMGDDVVAILNRQFHGGSRVTNCVVHMNKEWHDRPKSCENCMTDMANTIAYAVRVNEFLNQQVDDAKAAIAAIPATENIAQSTEFRGATSAELFETLGATPEKAQEMERGLNAVIRREDMKQSAIPAGETIMGDSRPQGGEHQRLPERPNRLAGATANADDVQRVNLLSPPPAPADDVMHRVRVAIAKRMRELWPDSSDYFTCPMDEELAKAALAAIPADDKPERIKRLIRETLDAPTFIEPSINCHNLTKTLQEIERILS